MVDFSEMLNSDREKTKSECMSEASTFLRSEIMKGKDKEIKDLHTKVNDLQEELKEMTAKFIKAACDAAKFQAMSAEKDLAVTEARDVGKTWFTLAETLRVDAFEIFKAWK